MSCCCGAHYPADEFHVGFFLSLLILLIFISNTRKMLTTRTSPIARQLIVVIITHYNTYPQRGRIVWIIDRLTFVAVVQQPSAHQVLKNIKIMILLILLIHTWRSLFVLKTRLPISRANIETDEFPSDPPSVLINICFTNKNSEALNYYTHTYLSTCM